MSNVDQAYEDHAKASDELITLARKQLSGGVALSPPAAAKFDLTPERVGLSCSFTVGSGASEVKMYIQTGEYADGTLGEVFIRANKQGTLVSGIFDSLSIVISTSLQHGVPLNRITSKLRGTQFEPSGQVHGGTGRCSSLVDCLCRWLDSKYG